jgi:hypothetical protein
MDSHSLCMLEGQQALRGISLSPGSSEKDFLRF